MMKRRLLVLGAAVPAVLAAMAGIAEAAPRQRAARRPGLTARRVQLRHAHTGHRFSGVYHDGRTADPMAMADLSTVLADSRTGAVLRDADSVQSGDAIDVRLARGGLTCVVTNRRK